MQNFFVLSVSIVLLVPVFVGADSYGNDIEDQPRLIKCTSGSDCASNECSVMGMQRYSEPRCEARGGLGSPCRMFPSGPENKTLHFPNTIMTCQEVYMQFCPCSSGLVCREAECRPDDADLETEDSSSIEEFNRQDYHEKRRSFPWALGRFH